MTAISELRRITDPSRVSNLYTEVLKIPVNKEEMSTLPEEGTAIEAIRNGLAALIEVAVDDQGEVNLPIEARLLTAFENRGYSFLAFNPTPDGEDLRGGRFLRFSQVSNVITAPGSRPGRPFAEVVRIEDLENGQMQVVSLSGRWTINNQTRNLFDNLEPGLGMVQVIVRNLKDGQLIIEKLPPDQQTQTLQTGATLYRY